MIKKIIVIGSGKGGVGKSTVSVNLAVSLAKKKLKIGLLDADIYGPSIPRMLGITKKPNASKEKKILPFLTLKYSGFTPTISLMRYNIFFFLSHIEIEKMPDNFLKASILYS